MRSFWSASDALAILPMDIVREPVPVPSKFRPVIALSSGPAVCDMTDTERPGRKKPFSILHDHE